jgi:hypothetical protein
MVSGFVTTDDLSKATGLAQRTVQKRIKRLGLHVLRAGKVYLLTPEQAERITKDNPPSGRPPKQSNGNGHK